MHVSPQKYATTLWNIGWIDNLLFIFFFKILLLRQIKSYINVGSNFFFLKEEGWTCQKCLSARWMTLLCQLKKKVRYQDERWKNSTYVHTSMIITRSKIIKQLIYFCLKYCSSASWLFSYSIHKFVLE